MEIELDPEQRKLLEALARENGKPLKEVVRSLLDEALRSRGADGREAQPPGSPRQPPSSGQSDVEELRVLLWSKSPEDLLKELPPELRALDAELEQIRRRMGPVDFGVAEAIDEMWE